MFFDGSKNADSVGADIVLSSPKGDKLHYVLRLNCMPSSNNVAEYEALLHGMRAAKDMSIYRLQCYGDSDLIANQTSGTYDTISPNMIAYHKAVDQLGGYFAGLSIKWIERKKNEEADALSRIGSSRKPPPPGIFLHIIDKPSVSIPKEIDIAEPLALDSTLVAMATDSINWTAPYITYLDHQVLPQDETEACMI
jgi:ribonuclease HI